MCVAVGDGAGVCVAVGSGVGVLVGVGVGIGVLVGVAVGIGVLVAVGVSVAVAVGVGVLVGVAVGNGVLVGVGVGVGVLVAVAVAVGVAVDVAVGIAVAVGVAVGAMVGDGAGVDADASVAAVGVAVGAPSPPQDAMASVAAIIRMIAVMADVVCGMRMLSMKRPLSGFGRRGARELRRRASPRGAIPRWAGTGVKGREGLFQARNGSGGVGSPQKTGAARTEGWESEREIGAARGDSKLDAQCGGAERQTDERGADGD